MAAIESCVYKKTLNSPIGRLHLIANADHLIAILFESDLKNNRVKLGSEKIKTLSQTEHNQPIEEAQKQLDEYFSGHRKSFKFNFKNILGTDFQKRVWAKLEEIPYGKTVSYKEIAEQIKAPQSVRAVATAIGKNPLSIIVPCHRVIGTNGALRGYAGGIKNKTFLLAIES